MLGYARNKGAVRNESAWAALTQPTFVAFGSLPLSRRGTYKARNLIGATRALRSPEYRGMAKAIHVLNGPNLNLLGTREPEKYGHATLADVERLCRTRAAHHGLEIVFKQSNHEGEIIDCIHAARHDGALAIVINPAGYTHTSIAILDALVASALPVFEVHITNIHARESFRHHSYVSMAARGIVCGFGSEGYGLAIDGLAALLGAAAD